MSASIVKAAAVQFYSQPGDVDGNLSSAETWIRRAAERQADIVLLPDLASGGHGPTFDLCHTAEDERGLSITWLVATARRFGLFVGMTYLETAGENYFDTFVLAGPDGEIVGRIRTNPPAFAGMSATGDDEHFIDTVLGRIGICVSHDALLHDRLAACRSGDIDLLLLPMAAGMQVPVAPIDREDCAAYERMLQGLAEHHARTLGVPVVMANHCGPLPTTIPAGAPFSNMRFPGLSTVVHATGEVASRLGDAEGIALACVELDPAKKAKSVRGSRGNVRGEARAALASMLTGSEFEGFVMRNSHEIS